MKVLHVSSGNLFGGVETVLATLARERASAPGMEPHFALCFSGRLSEELSAAGTPATLLGPIRSRYPWQVWQARRRLAALLKIERFDAVICHMPWALAIFGPVLKKAGVPLVFWMHDAASGKHWIERWAGRCRPDLVIANSRFTLGTLTRIYPCSTASAIVHCPVPAPPAADPIDIARLRVDMGVTERETVFIQVGRMDACKGHEMLIEALGHLLDVPDWKCWIVGGVQRPHEHEYVAALQARMASWPGLCERVRFVGEQRDVPRWLSAADVFCQPNVSPDAFGLVFVEALYAGLPVVTSAIGGALEVVDESCGLLLAPGDQRALASSLGLLLADRALRGRLSAQGPARARKLCDPTQVLIQLKNCLENLVPPLGPLSHQ
jgi:glycosyltransferase involved in cell wall biosynthesis